jgi:lysozyme family protein
MASFEQYRAAYNVNWANLRIRPERAAEVTREVNKLLAGKTRYLACEKRTGVPWWFIGLTHYRESHYNFNTYLGNGQPLNRVTTIVPKGRGPFATFEDGAEDAMKQMGFIGLKDWGIARTCYRLEAYNGFGYHSKGVNSPYLYGGSNIYGPPEERGGKYVADHVFNSNVVDKQLGTLTLLKKLVEVDSSVRLGPVSSGQPAAQTGIVVGGAGAAAGAAAAGWPWEAIAAIVAFAGLISLLVWHFMRRKPDKEPIGVEGMMVRVTQDDKK